MRTRRPRTPLRKEIGKRIRALRTEQHMMVVELADKLGLSQGYVSALEHGKYAFDIEFLCRIADALGVHVINLIEDDPSIVSKRLSRVWDRGEFRNLVYQLAKQFEQGHWSVVACSRILKIE